MANAAIQLDTEAYDADVERPVGRHSAGEGFLRGFLKYADVERFHLWNLHEQPQRDLEALLARLGPPRHPVEWLGRIDRPQLARVGALHLPSPMIGGEAWARRALGGSAYSLTGITHTFADAPTMDAIADLLLAPTEPWDALICASPAAHKAVEALLEGVAAYLGERLGASRIPPAQLVTIPLGIHPDDFRQDPHARHRWREQLDIPADAPTALHMGRLSIATKLHPGPTGLALAETARRLGRPVYWILFGRGRRNEDEAEFREAAAAFAGDDVHIRHVEDGGPAVRGEIVSAADVFVSLSDNIQETFGLTPLEAMASGLPCVVSDWDGYRDTVRHAVDGFRVRTLAPRAGLGSDLAYAYAHRLMSYERYAESAALLTAVDVGDAADALTALFSDPDLRARMGAAGQARVREIFDWRVVIPQYQALWAELNRRRRASPRQPGLENPYRRDPFRLFASYPSAAPAMTDMVELARPMASGEACERLGRAGNRREGPRLPSDEEVEALVAALAAGPLVLGALLAVFPPQRRPFLERGVLWLSKFGIVRLRDSTARN